MNRSILVGAVVLALTTPVHAGSPTTCAPDQAPDRFRLLRQLTLDLYGRIPTIDEYERVRDHGLAPADIDAMFESDEYYAGLREYFRSVIWGGLPEDVSAISATHLVVPQAGIWFAPNLRTQFRGRFNVSCLNQAQTQFDAAGRPLPISTFPDATCTGGACKQEGYVMVTPYWSPTPIKVCAFDAQALPTGIAIGATPAPACTPFARNAGCGCGPNLRFCLPTLGNEVHDTVRTAIADEGPRIFEWVAREGRSYFEAFTTPHSFVNGPLAQFYRELGGPSVPLQLGGRVTYDMRVTSPARSFADATWLPVERGDVHAGVLTTAGFMLRFASNRARVNRFYSAFRCEPFVPPAGGLPPEPAGLPDPNLRTRSGCAGCHDTIERAAAHWGRWRTTGQVGYLGPVDVSFEGARAECSTCTAATCSTFCDAYFITARNSTHPDELAAWKGWPHARAYLSADEAAAIDLGPRGLVDEPAEQATLASCAVRTLAERLLGRELSEDEVLGLLPSVTDLFARSGYQVNALYRALLDLPQYRTTR